VPPVGRLIGYATGNAVAGLPGHAAGSSRTPALPGGLASDAQPGADLGPGVAAGGTVKGGARVIAAGDATAGSALDRPALEGYTIGSV
jgi:hypothetical protein